MNEALREYLDQQFDDPDAQEIWLTCGGVYAIVCRWNARCYVASTIRTFNLRIAEHFNAMRKGEGVSFDMRADFSLYGESGFFAGVLSVWDGQNKAALRAEEKAWIAWWQERGLDLYNPEK